MTIHNYQNTSGSILTATTGQGANLMLFPNQSYPLESDLEVVERWVGQKLLKDLGPALSPPVPPVKANKANKTKPTKPTEEAK